MSAEENNEANLEPDFEAFEKQVLEFLSRIEELENDEDFLVELGNEIVKRYG